MQMFARYLHARLCVYVCMSLFALSISEAMYPSTSYQRIRVNKHISSFTIAIAHDIFLNPLNFFPNFISLCCLVEFYWPF